MELGTPPNEPSLQESPALSGVKCGSPLHPPVATLADLCSQRLSPTRSRCTQATVASSFLLLLGSHPLVVVGGEVMSQEPLPQCIQNLLKPHTAF